MFGQSLANVLSHFSFKGHQNSSYKIDSCLSFNDTYIISGSENGQIFIWDLIEAKVLHQIEHGLKGVVYSLSAHPRKNYLLSAASDSVKLWGKESETY